MAFRLSFRSSVIGIACAALFGTACNGSDQPQTIPLDDGGADGAPADSIAPGGPDAGTRDSGGGREDAEPDASTSRDGGVDSSVDASTDASSANDGSNASDANDASDAAPFVPGTVGNALPSLETANCPVRIAVDSKGVPYAAYVNNVTSLVEVSYLTGSTWMALPSPTMAGAYPTGYCHSIALEPNGNPVLAFRELLAGPTYQLEVQRWTGSAWQVLGGVMPSSYYTPSSEIATDASGRIVLATTTTPTFDVDVKRWDDVGAQWTPLGAPFHAVQAQAGELKLVLKPDGNPVVAWTEGTGGSNAAHLYVSEYDGTKWNVLGSALDGVPNATVSISAPNITYDGAPIVAWGKNPPRVRGVQRWNGASWVDVAPPPEAAPEYFKTAVLAAGGKITLVWGTDGNSFYQQFNGSSWGTSVPFHGPSIQKISEPVLATGGGRLYMAHQGAFNTGYVLRLPLP